MTERPILQALLTLVLFGLFILLVAFVLPPFEYYMEVVGRWWWVHWAQRWQ